MPAEQRAASFFEPSLVEESARTMFLSLPKLIGLAAVVWLVWMAFRFFEARQRAAADAANQPKDDDGKAAEPPSLDLEECDVCGAWVSGTPCERKNCPY